MATIAPPVSAAEYERIALAEPDRRWELHDGHLVEKPAMSIGHDWAQSRLEGQLHRQLDPEVYLIQSSSRLKRSDEHYYIPDVSVIPISLVEPDRTRWHELNFVQAPLPLVVEVWSPSTGGHDVDTKIPEYQRRGDQEIWRLHPFERTLTIWCRQPDGTYTETTVHGGTVSPIALPWVTIDLDAVFA